MAQSLAKIYIHLIFHIKTTSPKIRENDLERLHNYIGKLVKTTGCAEIKAGGVGDHVHVLFILSKDVTISQIVEEIKRNSSRWIKNLDPVYYHFFAWQGGYAAYSISQSVVDKTLQYIANQKEHHTKHSFAEEYRAFLKLYLDLSIRRRVELENGSIVKSYRKKIRDIVIADGEPEEADIFGVTDENRIQDLPF
jgi:putative transposase